MNSKWKKRRARLGAALTVFVFMTTSVSWGQPTPLLTLEQPPVFSKLLTSEIKIPENLGTIQTKFTPPSKDKPFVIVIQDAHSVLDAQNHIQKLIQYFEENYGVDLVAMEGAKGKLDPTILKMFPDNFVKNKVMTGYLSRGELTGSEMAAILNSKESDYEGIEDWNLYEANYLAYLKTMRQKEGIFKELEEIHSRMDRERKQIYSDSLNGFHEQLEKFENENTYLLQFLEYLGEVDGGREKIRAYPHLAKLYLSFEFEKEAEKDQGNIDSSIRQMAERFKDKYLAKMNIKQEMAFHKNYQAFVTNQMEAPAFLKYLIEIGQAFGVKAHLTPSLLRLLGYSETLNSIKGTKVFDELLSLIQEIENTLAVKAEEKGLAQKYRRLKFLKTLASLEITREQLLEYQKTPDIYLSLVEKGQEKFKDALEFYRYAVERDQSFRKNLKDLMAKKKSHAAIVLAGGFHAQGFENNLKEDGIPYVIITPKIESLSGQETYADVMQGKLSYKPYLKTTFYDAFMRHSAIQLVSELNEPDFRKNIKLWRDQIIRRLSKEGRITQAGAYTKYLDLLFKVYEEKYGKGEYKQKSKEELLKVVEKELNGFRDAAGNRLWERFQLQVHEWTEGVTRLIENKKLDVENMSGLLDRISQSKLSSLVPPRIALISDLNSELLRRFTQTGMIPGEVVSTETSGLAAATMPRYLAALAEIAGKAATPVNVSAQAQEFAQQISRTANLVEKSQEVRSAESADTLKAVQQMAAKISAYNTASFAAEVLKALGWEKKGELLVPAEKKTELITSVPSTPENSAESANDVTADMNGLRVQTGNLNGKLAGQGRAEVRANARIGTVVDFDTPKQFENWLSENMQQEFAIAESRANEIAERLSRLLYRIGKDGKRDIYKNERIDFLRFYSNLPKSKSNGKLIDIDQNGKGISAEKIVLGTLEAFARYEYPNGNFKMILKRIRDRRGNEKYYTPEMIHQGFSEVLLEYGSLDPEKNPGNPTGSKEWNPYQEQFKMLAQIYRNGYPARNIVQILGILKYNKAYKGIENRRQNRAQIFQMLLDEIPEHFKTGANSPSKTLAPTKLYPPKSIPPAAPTEDLAATAPVSAKDKKVTASDTNKRRFNKLPPNPGKALDYGFAQAEIDNDLAIESAIVKLVTQDLPELSKTERRPTVLKTKRADAVLNVITRLAGPQGEIEKQIRGLVKTVRVLKESKADKEFVSEGFKYFRAYRARLELAVQLLIRTINQMDADDRKVPIERAKARLADLLKRISPVAAPVSAKEAATPKEKPAAASSTATPPAQPGILVRALEVWNNWRKAKPTQVRPGTTPETQRKTDIPPAKPKTMIIKDNPFEDGFQPIEKEPAKGQDQADLEAFNFFKEEVPAENASQPQAKPEQGPETAGMDKTLDGSKEKTVVASEQKPKIASDATLSAGGSRLQNPEGQILRFAFSLRKLAKDLTRYSETNFSFVHFFSRGRVARVSRRLTSIADELEKFQFSQNRREVTYAIRSRWREIQDLLQDDELKKMGADVYEKYNELSEGVLIPTLKQFAGKKTQSPTNPLDANKKTTTEKQKVGLIKELKIAAGITVGDPKTKSIAKERLRNFYRFNRVIGDLLREIGQELRSGDYERREYKREIPGLDITDRERSINALLAVLDEIMNKTVPGEEPTKKTRRDVVAPAAKKIDQKVDESTGQKKSPRSEVRTKAKKNELDNLKLAYNLREGLKTVDGNERRLLIGLIQRFQFQYDFTNEAIAEEKNFFKSPAFEILSDLFSPLPAKQQTGKFKTRIAHYIEQMGFDLASDYEKGIVYDLRMKYLGAGNHRAAYQVEWIKPDGEARSLSAYKVHQAIPFEKMRQEKELRDLRLIKKRYEKIAPYFQEPLGLSVDYESKIMITYKSYVPGETIEEITINKMRELAGAYRQFDNQRAKEILDLLQKIYFRLGQFMGQVYYETKGKLAPDVHLKNALFVLEGTEIKGLYDHDMEGGLAAGREIRAERNLVTLALLKMSRIAAAKGLWHEFYPIAASYLAGYFTAKYGEMNRGREDLVKNFSDSGKVTMNMKEDRIDAVSIAQLFDAASKYFKENLRLSQYGQTNGPRSEVRNDSAVKENPNQLSIDPDELVDALSEEWRPLSQDQQQTVEELARHFEFIPSKDILEKIERNPDSFDFFKTEFFRMLRYMFTPLRQVDNTDQWEVPILGLLKSLNISEGNYPDLTFQFKLKRLGTGRHKVAYRVDVKEQAGRSTSVTASRYFDFENLDETLTRAKVELQTLKDIQAYPKIRDQFQKHYGAWISPNNKIMVVMKSYLPGETLRGITDPLLDIYSGDYLRNLRTTVDGEPAWKKLQAIYSEVGYFLGSIVRETGKAATDTHADNLLVDMSAGNIRVSDIDIEGGLIELLSNYGEEEPYDNEISLADLPMRGFGVMHLSVFKGEVGTDPSFTEMAALYYANYFAAKLNIPRNEITEEVQNALKEKMRDYLNLESQGGLQPGGIQWVPQPDRSIRVKRKGIIQIIREPVDPIKIQNYQTDQLEELYKIAKGYFAEFLNDFQAREKVNGKQTSEAKEETLTPSSDQLTVASGQKNGRRNATAQGGAETTKSRAAASNKRSRSEVRETDEDKILKQIANLNVQVDRLLILTGTDKKDLLMSLVDRRIDERVKKAEEVIADVKIGAAKRAQAKKIKRIFEDLNSIDPLTKTRAELEQAKLRLKILTADVRELHPKRDLKIKRVIYELSFLEPETAEQRFQLYLTQNNISLPEETMSNYLKELTDLHFLMSALQSYTNDWGFSDVLKLLPPKKGKERRQKSYVTQETELNNYKIRLQKLKAGLAWANEKEREIINDSDRILELRKKWQDRDEWKAAIQIAGDIRDPRKITVDPRMVIDKILEQLTRYVEFLKLQPKLPQELAPPILDHPLSPSQQALVDFILAEVEKIVTHKLPFGEIRITRDGTYQTPLMEKFGGMPVPIRAAVQDLFVQIQEPKENQLTSMIVFDFRMTKGQLARAINLFSNLYPNLKDGEYRDAQIAVKTSQISHATIDSNTDLVTTQMLEHFLDQAQTDDEMAIEENGERVILYIIPSENSKFLPIEDNTEESDIPDQDLESLLKSTVKSSVDLQISTDLIKDLKEISEGNKDIAKILRTRIGEILIQHREGSRRGADLAGASQFKLRDFRLVSIQDGMRISLLGIFKREKLNSDKDPEYKRYEKYKDRKGYTITSAKQRDDFLKSLEIDYQYVPETVEPEVKKGKSGKGSSTAKGGEKVSGSSGKSKESGSKPSSQKNPSKKRSEVRELSRQETFANALDLKRGVLSSPEELKVFLAEVERNGGKPSETRLIQTGEQQRDHLLTEMNAANQEILQWVGGQMAVSVNVLVTPEFEDRLGNQIGKIYEGLPLPEEEFRALAVKIQMGIVAPQLAGEELPVVSLEVKLDSETIQQWTLALTKIMNELKAQSKKYPLEFILPENANTEDIKEIQKVLQDFTPFLSDLTIVHSANYVVNQKDWKEFSGAQINLRFVKYHKGEGIKTLDKDQKTANQVSGEYSAVALLQGQDSEFKWEKTPPYLPYVVRGQYAKLTKELKDPALRTMLLFAMLLKQGLEDKIQQLGLNNAFKKGSDGMALIIEKLGELAAELKVKTAA